MVAFFMPFNDILMFYDCNGTIYLEKKIHWIYWGIYLFELIFLALQAPNQSHYTNAKCHRKIAIDNTNRTRTKTRETNPRNDDEEYVLQKHLW